MREFPWKEGKTWTEQVLRTVRNEWWIGLKLTRW